MWCRRRLRVGAARGFVSGGGGVQAGDGGILFRAPVGGYLLLRLVHEDGTSTPAVPQAIMDHRNNAIPESQLPVQLARLPRGLCIELSSHEIQHYI